METSATKDLRDVLTKSQPLGPRATEDILNHREAFLELYEHKAELAEQIDPKRPAYVVGRKGAGKTAFLIGESFSSGRQVVSIKAANAFSVMDDLRLRWENARGTIPVDNMVHLWEALLVHGAMRGVSQDAQLSDATLLGPINSYLHSIDPTMGSKTHAEDQFLSALGRKLIEAIDEIGSIASVREVVANVGSGRIKYSAARAHFFQLLERRDSERGLCVVVDNLEDLHMRVDELAPVLAGLFRIVSRVTDPSDPIPLPFELRFAFPAEMTKRLRQITANPEKDFRNALVIEWTAAELIQLAGLRIRKSLEVNFKEGELKRLVPAALSPDEVLRAVLPRGDIVNGLGGVEDPVAYIMRHTQLLPRHLIQILNAVLLPVYSEMHLRRVTRAELLKGVRAAEPTIVSGILSSYSNDYPYLGECLARLQNRIPFSMTRSELRQAYNKSGAKRVSGERFEDFLWSAVSAGAIGIKLRTTERYVVGEFSYTFEGSLQPVDDDDLCVHPLFVHVLNDHRALDRRRKAEDKPIYPYGSGGLEDGDL